MNCTDGTLRSDSALSVEEREMKSTYTSGLDACKFYDDSHKVYAELFGFDTDLMTAMLEDWHGAPIDNKLRPLPGHICKLNALPCRLADKDAQAVYDAGWSGKAFFKAGQVNALFNMMNRMIEGTGINFDYCIAPERHSARGSTPEARMDSYARFGRQVT